MSIVITCPSCGVESQANVADAGTRGKCRACGGVVQVPGRARKTCCACGVDVSGQPRTKDTQGQYYCNPCWSDRQAAAAAAVTPTVEPDALDDVAAALDDARQAKRRSKTGSFWSNDGNVIAAILIPIVLVGGIFLTWIFWPARQPNVGESAAAKPAHASASATDRQNAAPVVDAAEQERREAAASRAFAVRIAPFV